MTKRYAPPFPDPSYHRPDDEPYFHELLRVAGLSQTAAGLALGMNARSVRNRFGTDRKSNWTYPEQFTLESLADAKLREQAGVHESAPAYGATERPRTVWHRVADRPLQRSDVGKMVVGKDQFGVPLLGELAHDDFGLLIRSSEGLDVRKRPVEQVAVYTLLDPPPG